MPGCHTEGLRDVIVQIDGKVNLSQNIKYYPDNYKPALLSHSNSTNLTYRGEGKINGRGWLWWFFFTVNKDPYRPYLVEWDKC